MGTDRWPEQAETCRCGEGKYVLYLCEPDHGYSSNRWTELAIECPRCAAEYQLVQQSGHAALVKRNAVEAQEMLGKKWNRKSAEVLNSATGQAVLNDGITAIEALPSAAAQHRALSQLTHVGGIATFRKDIIRGGVREWMRRHIGAGDLHALMRFLKRRDPEFEAELAKVETLWKEYRAPLPEEAVLFAKR